MMNYVAIDFETATSKWDSACSVAVVDVKDGVISDSYYTLIKPPDMKFTPYNIRIHGIRPKDVAYQPDFAGIWPELSKRLEGKIVIAHNATFDMGVLRHCLERQSLEPVDFLQCDTVGIAQKVWPELENHKLNTIGDFLQLKFKHHNALEDARICACIPLAAGKTMGMDDLTELASKLQQNVKPFTMNPPESNTQRKARENWIRRHRAKGKVDEKISS